MIIPIDPVSKPRMTRRDVWANRPPVVRYFEFADNLRKAWKGRRTQELPDSVAMVFNIPMPPSWSEKRKTEMENKPHQQRPDIDNYIKAVLDALCEDDSYVYRVKGEKYWSREGRIKIYEY